MTETHGARLESEAEKKFFTALSLAKIRGFFYTKYIRADHGVVGKHDGHNTSLIGNETDEGTL